MFAGGELAVWIPGGLRPTGIPLRGLARVTQARFGWGSLRVGLASGGARFGWGSLRVGLASGGDDFGKRPRQPSVSIEWV
jgi:hypothetical protein